MHTTISRYYDHRGWNALPQNCHASVHGSMRLKQCSRKAKALATFRQCGITGATDQMPVCTQHAGAYNVKALEALS